MHYTATFRMRLSASRPARRTRTQLVGFSLRPLVSGSHLFYLVLA